MLQVRTWMTQNLVTLSPEASVAEALTLCRERRIRHIPIVEEGRLVGIVSDRDLRDASPALGDADRASTLQEIRVGDVMTREVSTADPQDPIEILSTRDVRTEDRKPAGGGRGGQEKLLGIVTSSDVMRALVMSLGCPSPVAGSKSDAEQGGDPGRGSR